VAIEKQRTALVIPNAIWVLTADHEVRMPLGLDWIGQARRLAYWRPDGDHA
jgi:hypothetical protein